MAKRRVALGRNIVETAGAGPTAKFSEDGKHLILTIPVKSKAVEDNDTDESEKHTSRDLDPAQVASSNFHVAFYGTGENSVLLSVEGDGGGKIPGTGS